MNKWTGFLVLSFLALSFSSAFASEGHECEQTLEKGEFLKMNIEKCLIQKKLADKNLSVDDSIRLPGKEVKNSRAPSVEVFYRRASRQ